MVKTNNGKKDSQFKTQKFQKAIEEKKGSHNNVILINFKNKNK